MNYRGYGGTKGRPSETALFEDALAIYDYAIGAGGAAPEDIIVMGRSLGSGIAAMLAAQRKVRAAVLVTPYDSIAAIASRHYPFLPVDRLLRHRFQSIDFAGRANVPALFLIAENDSIIPPLHGELLAKAWSGEKEVHVLKGVGHNDIERNSDYYSLLNEFISRGGAREPDARHAAL